MSTLLERHLRIPKYLQLAEHLRLLIANGTLGPGARVPSFNEMRAQFGATQQTMERVYGLLEQEGLIVRQRSRGIFVAEPQLPVAHGLIGFVGSHFSMLGRHIPYAALLVSGIQEVVHREERRVLLLDHSSPAGWDKVDGVLISRRESEHALRYLLPGLPCVSLVHTIKGVGNVVADDAKGARLAVQHLLELGHRRIAFLADTTAPLIRQRLNGYRSALRKADIEPDPLWLRSTPSAADPETYFQWGKESMAQWLREDWKKVGCTALLAQNDDVAMGAMEALRAAGIKVPEQVSVIGFDSTSVCDLCSPPLTSVHIPLKEIGEIGTQLLLQQIEAGRAQPERKVLPTQLTIRKTTTVAPKK